MVGSLRSLSRSRVAVARLRSLALLGRAHASIASLVHGDERVIVLISINMIHALSLALVSAHTFIYVFLILFIRFKLT